MRFKIQFSLTLYTPPAPCRKGEGQLGQGVHKVLESQSSVCQDENTVKMKKVFWLNHQWLTGKVNYLTWTGMNKFCKGQSYTKELDTQFEEITIKNSNSAKSWMSHIGDTCRSWSSWRSRPSGGCPCRGTAPTRWWSGRTSDLLSSLTCDIYEPWEK